MIYLFTLIYLFYSCIPIQLDWIFVIDVFLSHYCFSLWCAGWFWIVSDKVDTHCQTLHRSCFAWEFMALVVDNGIWYVCLKNLVERYFNVKIIIKNIEIYYSRSFNLCTCHHSIFEHQTRLEITIWQRTGASSFFLLKNWICTSSFLDSTWL